MSIIGEKETISDMKKSKRPDNLIFKLDKKCPSNYKNNYEWSDLKSSLLVQEIVNNDVEYNGLSIFMREILERLILSGFETHQFLSGDKDEILIKSNIISLLCYYYH
jgi:hypothetical protein